MTDPVTVADCERVQTDWYRTRAEVLGGEVRVDDGLTWLRGPDDISLMFPTELSVGAVARGRRWAEELGVSVGVWLSLATDPAPLADQGFEEGWSPWWMVADLSALGPADDPRIELQEDTADYGRRHAGYRAELAVARARPKRTWYAAAYTARRHRFAGRAWSHRVGDLAGIFDMAVWPRFRRKGLGTGLLRAVGGAAREAGAGHGVLNATPEGKRLYETCGFVQIGEGITWWFHPRSHP